MYRLLKVLLVTLRVMNLTYKYIFIIFIVASDFVTRSDLQSSRNKVNIKCCKHFIICYSYTAEANKINALYTELLFNIIL